MDQLFCTACGHPIDAGDHFCTGCGAQVVSSASAATRPTAAAPTTTSSSAAPVPDPTMVHPAPMPFPASASHISGHPHASRGRTRSRVRFWGWVAAAALFVAAVSYGLGTVAEHPDRSTASATGGASAAPSPRRSPSAKASADPQAMAQARALQTLITQSATDKQRIATAAGQLQRCDHVAQAIEAFADAAASRDRLVDQAAGLEVGLLPGGGAAIADLSSALRAAAQADRAYVAWGETRHNVTVTVPGSGSGSGSGKGHGKKHHRPQRRRVCRGGAQREANAVRLSAASHGAKQEAARAWNIVAAQFGLPTISWTEL